MDVFEAIKNRRSLRKFTDEPVEPDLVRRIIAAGMMAPSAGNERPWHFIVIKNPQTLEALASAHPFCSVLSRVPVAILVCGDRKSDHYGGYWLQDCAAATMNMLLAIHALELGSVWIGVAPREQRIADVRRVIKLPEHIEPFAILPIGYPAEERGSEGRFLRSRIHNEKW